MEGRHALPPSLPRLENHGDPHDRQHVWGHSGEEEEEEELDSTSSLGTPPSPGPSSPPLPGPVAGRCLAGRSHLSPLPPRQEQGYEHPS